jgi:hypothetical protein
MTTEVEAPKLFEFEKRICVSAYLRIRVIRAGVSREPTVYENRKYAIREEYTKKRSELKISDYDVAVLFRFVEV